VFDRFHLSQHVSRAVDEVRRQTWRRMRGREKAEFKKTRFLWLSNPENLRREERTRKVISHRAFGYRTSWAYIANIYHSCAGLPLP
jgi:transposase